MTRTFTLRYEYFANYHPFFFLSKTIRQPSQTRLFPLDAPHWKRRRKESGEYLFVYLFGILIVVEIVPLFMTVAISKSALRSIPFAS
jgi:hypothetical protein